VAAGENSSLNHEEPLYPPGSSSYFYVQADVSQVACLERVDEDRKPKFVDTARTRCLWCDHWCWLGDNSMQLILSGQAAPMCFECGEKLLPGNAVQVGRVKDTTWDEWE
jgi:hypothetical protein